MLITINFPILIRMVNNFSQKLQKKFHWMFVIKYYQSYNQLQCIK